MTGSVLGRRLKPSPTARPKRRASRGSASTRAWNSVSSRGSGEGSADERDEDVGLWEGHARVLASFQEARKKYPGVRFFTVDHTGERPVARPRRSTSHVEQEQQRLSRRLREISAQEQQQLARPLSGLAGRRTSATACFQHDALEARLAEIKTTLWK